MRRNISLWINGQRADINDDTLIQFNFLRTDLDNPTIVRNSYSQSVVLPATPTNNRIFGSYYRLDSVVGETGFDIWNRNPFEIYDEKMTMLERGYFRLEEIKRRDGGIYSYSIGLYGGLGGFFYQLSMQDSGDALNLGDLLYVSSGYSVRPNDEGKIMSLQAGTIADCWREACGQPKVFPSYSLWSFFLQFAPCYNGIPENFDANKCLVNATPEIEVNDYAAIRLQSGEYSHQDVTNDCVLVTMATPKDEWIMRDFRAYLQRPVLSVREVFRAIPYSISDYRFSWSQRVDDIIKDLWITLIQPKQYDDYSSYPMHYIFEKSISPAQLLIGIAKMFGFVFRFTRLNEVEVMTRAEYYAAGLDIDLSQRIDRSREISVSPYVMDARFYVWKNDIAEGGFSKEYRERFDKTFGQLIVNTNYNFAEDKKDVLEKLAIRSGIMTVEESPMMRWTGPVNIQGWRGPITDFVISWYEEVTYQYFAADRKTEAGKTRVMLFPSGGDVRGWWYNAGNAGMDIRERLQLADASNKPIDGANILLYKDGYDVLPYSDVPSFFWHISNDDTTTINALNNGVPCYDLRKVNPNAVKIERIPRYSRYSQGKSLDFGYPLLRSVAWLDPVQYEPLYYAHWANNFADRMDKDTKIVRCYVNLNGLDVGQDMLRNFYYFDNSMWVLSKIENHLVGGNGLTLCEFIKVQEKDNYIE